MINFKVARRLVLNCSCHKEDIRIMGQDRVLVYTMAVIILSYISVSNQHVVHLQLTQCYCQLYLMILT